MSIALMPGSRLPGYCTSMGRVLLAALPEAAARDILDTGPLPARTELTLTDPERIIAELARIRAQGYAVINQEVEMGLCSIAVPVLNARGRTIAALNIGRSAAAAPFDLLPDLFLPALIKVQTELRSVLN